MCAGLGWLPALARKIDGRKSCDQFGPVHPKAILERMATVLISLMPAAGFCAGLDLSNAVASRDVSLDAGLPIDGSGIARE
jgi:hypothetical protein